MVCALWAALLAVHPLYHLALDQHHADGQLAAGGSVPHPHQAVAVESADDCPLCSLFNTPTQPGCAAHVHSLRATRAAWPAAAALRLPLASALHPARAPPRDASLPLTAA